MSYTPTTWVTGDTVTPEKLNKIEQGIYDAGGTSSVFFVVAYYNGGAWIMQETAGDIINALSSGIPVMVQERDAVTGEIEGECSNIFSIEYTNSNYWFWGENTLGYSASSLTDYPTADGGGE